MDKARIYQSYLAEKQHGRGVFVRVARLYSISDERVRQIVREYEASPKQASVIKAFSPKELRYIPAPLEVEYQAERDRLARDLAHCQQADLLCQLVLENANCENTALDSAIWQTQPTWQVNDRQTFERESHCCGYADFAKSYSCAACFGPGLGWSVVTCLGVSLSQIGFISAIYRLHGSAAWPVLMAAAILLAWWLALTMMLSAAWLDTVFVAWRLWLAAFGLVMFLIIGVGVGL